MVSALKVLDVYVAQTAQLNYSAVAEWGMLYFRREHSLSGERHHREVIRSWNLKENEEFGRDYKEVGVHIFQKQVQLNDFSPHFSAVPPTHTSMFSKRLGVWPRFQE